MNDNIENQAFSRRDKESHIDTIRYEIEMLGFTIDWLVAHGPQHSPKREMWAMLESYLVHYRNLLRFLAGHESRGGLTMAVPEVWATLPFDDAKAQEIRKAAKVLYDKYHEKISTYLAHNTPARLEVPVEWRPTEMHRELVPVIDLFGRTFLAPVSSVTRHFLGNEAFGTATVTKVDGFPSGHNEN